MSVLSFRPDGSVGAYNFTETNSSLFQVNGEWIATSVDKRFYVADRAMAVQSVQATVAPRRAAWRVLRGGPPGAPINEDSIPAGWNDAPRTSAATAFGASSCLT